MTWRAVRGLSCAWAAKHKRAKNRVRGTERSYHPDASRSVVRRGRGAYMMIGNGTINRSFSAGRAGCAVDAAGDGLGALSGTERRRNRGHGGAAGEYRPGQARGVEDRATAGTLFADHQRRSHLSHGV